jgi:hypothetical protein
VLERDDFAYQKSSRSSSPRPSPHRRAALSDAWVKVWQALSYRQADTEWINLGKRQALVTGLAC